MARYCRKLALKLINAGVSMARIFWAFDGLYEAAARVQNIPSMRGLLLVIAGDPEYDLHPAQHAVADENQPIGLIIRWCDAVGAAGPYDAARLEFNRNRARLIGRVADVYPQWNAVLNTNPQWAPHPSPPRFPECLERITYV